MKTKEQIMDDYAEEQGYEDWNHLYRNNVIRTKFDLLSSHINNVIDLIQNELKNRIALIEDINLESFDEFGDSEDIRGVSINEILNTPNL